MRVLCSTAKKSRHLIEDFKAISYVDCSALKGRWPQYSRLSLSRHRLSRMTIYLVKKIGSLFKNENLTKLLWKGFRSNFSIFPQYSGVKLHIHLWKFGFSIYFILSSANLICLGTDILKTFQRVPWTSRKRESTVLNLRPFPNQPYKSSHFRLLFQDSFTLSLLTRALSEFTNTSVICKYVFSNRTRINSKSS